MFARLSKSSHRTSSSLLLLASVTLMACAPTNATGNPTSLSGEASEPTVPVAVSTLAASDVEGRLSSLEQKVGSLEKDMGDAKPTLAKVAVIERQFRSLSLELDRIDQEALGTKTSMKPVATEFVAVPVPAIVKDNVAAPAKPTPTKAKTETVAVKGEKAVTGVRFGSKGANATRIVVDGGKPVSMTSDLDNNEKILVLEIKGLDWKTAKSRSSISSPLVASYSAQDSDDGSRLVLQLKKAVRVGKVQSLGPQGENGHRAFIDLTAQ